ncbi:MAG: N-acetylmuramoyl-L-alanine amidase, partial [Chthoniobacterales bacterium]|nr:N-acetylmuramoyl-L-alanine amidase [Chthoniobacterales bacterium]
MKIETVMFRSVRFLTGAFFVTGMLMLPPHGLAANLSPLGTAPDWASLEKYQRTITHAEFQHLIETVYCPHGIGDQLLQIDEESARILMDREAQTWWTLRFAKTDAARKPVARYWRRPFALPAPKPGKVLSDLRIALDPGHIGGAWAKMEERWLQVADKQPVQEGDMTLRVAQILAPRLRALGAKVSLVRDKLEPITAKRPDDFMELARQILARNGTTEAREDYQGADDPLKEQTVRWQSEILFYRQSEIRARAERVNNKIRPDLVLCLHFNAEPWGDASNPTLVDKDHFHLLVNGAYLEAELLYDDGRFEMIRRLLLRTSPEEAALAEKLALSMQTATQLPPYEYTTDNVRKIGSTGYVYARNLIANRLYR